MANILVITANLGKPELHKSSGGAERTTTLIEGLKDHNVTVLGFSWNTINKDIIVDGVRYLHPGVDQNVLRNRATLLRESDSNNTDLCINRLYKAFKGYRATLQKLLTNTDLVILDHASASGFLRDIPEDIPVIYNSHNAEIVMAKQLYPAFSKDIDTTALMEAAAVENSSAMTYCSEKDFEQLKHYYKLPEMNKFVANGAVKQPVVPVENRFRSKQILFVGSGHPPNGVAAKNIIPIAKAMPDYEFIVCGDAGWAIGKFHPANIKVLGRVSDQDLDKYFKQAFAFINPMESGSGTHLKMMKALAYGVPIITSTVGARGFTQDEIKASMLIADTTEDNIKAIKDLENLPKFESLIAGAKKVFVKYDWDTINADYAAFVEEVLEKKPPRTRKKDSVLIYSIVRDMEKYVDRYYEQISFFVRDYPNADFYLSIYENDSVDNTVAKLKAKDWSFLKGFVLQSENIKTQKFGSVKDATRVENLAKARNKAIECEFLDKVDYVLMIESDNAYATDAVTKLLDFRFIEPDFDVVSAVSLKSNRHHYDCWATRTTAIYNPNKSELDPEWNYISYGKYYSTSNGICLYRAKPFQEGIRHGWINKETKEFDCEMVVVCQNFIEAGYDNIYIKYNALSHH